MNMKFRIAFPFLRIPGVRGVQSAKPLRALAGS